MAALFMRSSIVYLELVFLFMFLTMLEAKTHVRIINSLPDHPELTVHCKSRDDDLGFQHLSYNSSYEFRFRPNFIVPTRFSCSFEWPSISHQFPIYHFKRDGWCQYTNSLCAWDIVPSGPCKHLNNGSFWCFPGWDAYLPGVLQTQLPLGN